MRQAVLRALLAARADRRPAVLLTHLGSGAQAVVPDTTPTPGDLPLTPELTEAAEAARRTDRAATVDTETGAVFVQPYNPPLRLVVVGAVHIAQALVPMAALAGYDVTVVDPRRAFAGDGRFPGVAVRGDWPDEALAALAPDARTAVVTLTHDSKLDDPALDAALRCDAFYIAALGSRKTQAARLGRLARLGHGEAALARIHGPAGLPIGAATPAEIAVSILAQMTGVLRGRT
jgi:xanthine dehydrogenase accessory factor